MSEPIAPTGSSVDRFVQQKYKHGFVTDIESEGLPPGLDEDVVRWISARRPCLTGWARSGPG